MRFGKIKADKSVTLPHVIHKEKKQEKSDIRRERKVTHKYNTISRVKHVTTFKNSPKMFKMDVTDTEKAHIGSDYIAHTDPQKDKIKVEPLSHHIHCETNGKILGYRYLVKMNTLVWKILCATNLDAYPRVGKNMRELMQSNLFSTKTNQSTEGQHM